MRSPLFNYFDWLHERGLLSSEGTWRDYAIVIGSALAFAAPIVFLLLWFKP